VKLGTLANMPIGERGIGREEEMRNPLLYRHQLVRLVGVWSGIVATTLTVTSASLDGVCRFCIASQSAVCQFTCDVCPLQLLNESISTDGRHVSKRKTACYLQDVSNYPRFRDVAFHHPNRFVLFILQKRDEV
jgi:hypothetical protein